MTQTRRFLSYKQHQLYLESTALSTVAAHHGTPVYVYSLAQIRYNWQQFASAVRHQDLVCFAVKANANLHLLKRLNDLGAGFDIVSGGELACVLRVGGDPKKIVFSGLGKRVDEIEAALNVGILSFHVESIPELQRIEAVAKRLQKIAPISIRINPNIDPHTHPHIATGLEGSKFGVDSQTAYQAYLHIQQSPWLDALGMACHIGSQLTQLQPFLDAFDHLLALYQRLQEQHIDLRYIDVGGGLGIADATSPPPNIKTYVHSFIQHMPQPTPVLIFEPGRALIADAGILLTRIEYIKPHSQKPFVIVDSAMNDFLRPALYNAPCTIWPVRQHSHRSLIDYHVVGPVCECSDSFGEHTLAVDDTDILALLDVGAYGFSMSSHYNARLQCPEILVDGEQHTLIRQRDDIVSLWHNQPFLPDGERHAGD